MKIASLQKEQHFDGESLLLSNQYTAFFRASPTFNPWEMNMLQSTIPTFSPQLPTSLNFLNLVDLYYRIY